LIAYINEEQYTFWLHKKEKFYLLFEVSGKTNKTIFSLIQDCIINDFFLGIVFIVNKDEVLFERLFFFRALLEKLVQNSKKTGMWGLPYCVTQYILGEDTFARLVPGMIPEQTDEFCKLVPVHRKNSSLLLSCGQCVAVSDCDGLGSRVENHRLYFFRRDHEFRKNGRDRLFCSRDTALRRSYEAFCEYVDRSDLTFANRCIYFTKNIDLTEFGAQFSFTDRFVYHCNHLPEHECAQEYNALSKLIKNNKILTQLKTFFHTEKVNKIAYSIACRDAVRRESLYVSLSDEKADFLLGILGIEHEISRNSTLYGVGIDFYGNMIVSYKVYQRYRYDALVEELYPYLDIIPLDIGKMRSRYHHVGYRFNTNHELMSMKIEIASTLMDETNLHDLFTRYPVVQNIFFRTRILHISFDFIGREMQKISLYYRNKYGSIRAN